MNDALGEIDWVRAEGLPWDMSSTVKAKTDPAGYPCVSFATRLVACGDGEQRGEGAGDSRLGQGAFYIAAGHQGGSARCDSALDGGTERAPINLES